MASSKKSAKIVKVKGDSSSSSKIKVWSEYGRLFASGGTEEQRQSALKQAQTERAREAAKPTYIVKDTATGEQIRETKFGTKIADVQLQARAKEVSKIFTPSRVSAQVAQARAKQDLGLIARAEQIKTEQSKIRQQLEKDRTQAMIKGAQERELIRKQLNKLGLKPSVQEVRRVQQSRLQTTIQENRIAGYYNMLEKEAKAIDKSNLSTLEKEEKKRALYGIESGMLAKKRIQEIQNTQFLIPPEVPTTYIGYEKIKGDIGSRDVKVYYNTARELIPFANKDSASALKKGFKGNFKQISGGEIGSLALDMFSLVGVGAVVRAAKGGYKGYKAYKVNKAIKLLANNPTKAKVFLNGGVSIIKNVGTANRVTNSASEYYKVDTNYLRKVAKDTGYKNDKELYNDYYNTIASNFRDSKFKAEDFANFVGVDSASKKSIIAGQQKFRNALKNQGYSDKEAKKIIGNLENKRIARIWGQALGMVAVETSSERIGQKFISAGMSKSQAVGLAGVREGLAVLGQQYYVQGYKLDSGDFVLAVLGGYTGSVFFSNQKLPDLRAKDIKKVQETLAKDLNKRATLKQKENYFVNTIKSRTDTDLTDEALKSVFNKLSNTEKKLVTTKYIEKVLKNTRKQSSNVIKSKFKKLKGKIETKEEALRSFSADIIDPAERVGDVLAEVPDRLRNKINKLLKEKSKLKKTTKKTSKKAKKIRGKALVGGKSSGSKTKGKSKVLGKAKEKAKNKAKEKTKLTAKQKAKVTSKTKSKTKTKMKAKSKSKSKSKTKMKAKSKSKSKTKTKMKVKTIKFPIIKPKLPKSLKRKGNIGYNVYKIVNNKKILLQRGIPLNLGLKKARESLQSKKVSKTILVKSGRTLKKDIMSPNLKKFKVIKGLTDIRVEKVMKKTITRHKKSSKKTFKSHKRLKTNYKRRKGKK